MRFNEATAAFSGERLRLARFRAALTIKELGERAGISHAAVSQYETGRTRPTAATLSRIAMATGVSPGFFSFDRRPVSMSGLDDTHFRSLRSTTKIVRSNAWAWSEISLDVVDVLERHVRFPVVDLPEFYLSDSSTEEDIVDAAARLRTSWKLPTGPVGHLVTHMEAHGVVVARLAAADHGVDAFSHFQGRRPVVVLGLERSDGARSRFDAAHELGHLVCHPEADPGGGQELQAHAFAAELLMPRDYMRRVLPSRFDLGTYARLKHEWGVSIAALLYRARKLDVISDPAYRRAVVWMNKAYGRRHEPYPLQNPERPQLMRAATDLALSKGLAIENIANEACISVDDLLQVVGEPDPRPSVALHSQAS